MKSFSRIYGCTILLFVIFVFVTFYNNQVNTPSAPTTSRSVLGVVVTENEDEWHSMVLNSILSTASAQGYDVITLSAERSSASQAEQIRALLIYQVNAIVFSPIGETGWDYVFQEAHEAGIPIVTVDKRASTTLDNLISYVGFDYSSASYDAANNYLAAPFSHEGYIVELCGTVGASSTREITGGFNRCLRQAKTPLRINYSVCTNFMPSRSKEVIEGLASNGYSMDLILSHSDGITLGAVDALEATGQIPGENVQIYAFGGSPAVLNMQRDGRIYWLAYLDPALLGTQTIAEVQRRLSGTDASEYLCPIQILSRGET